MVKVDRDVLVHSFDYYEYLENDRYHQPTYAESKTISHCRIDYSLAYSRDPDEKKHDYDAVIFCYARETKPFIEFKVQSKVNVNNATMTIKRVVPITLPFSSDLFAYELEVGQ